MEIRFFVLCLPLLLRTQILESVVKTFNIYRRFQYSLSWNLNPALMFCDSRQWYRKTHKYRLSCPCIFVRDVYTDFSKEPRGFSFTVSGACFFSVSRSFPRLHPSMNFRNTCFFRACLTDKPLFLFFVVVECLVNCVTFNS